MKINNTGKPVLREIAEKQSVRKSDVKKTGKNIDTRRVSTGAFAEVTHAFNVDPEYPPRMDLIATVSKRISSGAYQQQLLTEIADKVSTASPVKGVMDEVIISNRKSENNGISDTVREKMQQGYYDNPDILQSIAEKLMISLGNESM